MDLGIKKHTIEYVRQLLDMGNRIDGRSLNSHRKIRVIPNYVKNAEGSAYVELGNTKVLAGVKFSIGEPYPDTPDEGVFIVSLEYIPSSHPEVEAGPPSPEAIEEARIIDRAIRESKFIDTKSMVIEEGKAVWIMYIDIYVINDDGNVPTAGLIAALVSILTSRYPKYEIKNGEYIVNNKELTQESVKINLGKLPLIIAISKINNKLVVDPVKYEILASDVLMYVALSSKGIHGIQKIGFGSLTLEEINNILSLSQKQYNKIRKSILEAVKNAK